MIKIGVYQITNICNGRFYIGSSMQLSKRKNAHFALLRLNNHHNKYMQNDYNLYNQECFTFHVLEETDPETQLQVEQLYINKYYDAQDLCYNAATNVDMATNSKGRTVSEETRLKMSLARKGKPNPNRRGILHTPETKEKMRLAKLGKKQDPAHAQAAAKARIGLRKGIKMGPLSEETKQKLSIAHKGKKLTPEHIAKVAASHRGRKHTEEARKNMSLAHLGKPGHKHTEDSKRKLSEAHMGKPKPPLSDAHKAKLSAAHKGRPGKPLSEETKQKIRESVKTQYRFEGKYAKKAA